MAHHTLDHAVFKKKLLAYGSGNFLLFMAAI